MHKEVPPDLTLLKAHWYKFVELGYNKKDPTAFINEIVHDYSGSKTGETTLAILAPFLVLE